jgi:excisionase family DNA binding protein
MIQFGDHVPAVLTIGDMQKLLRIGRTAAFEILKSGELRSIRFGRSRRVLRVDLERYVARLAKDAGDDKAAA